ncbi:MAG TPA: PA2169 family four-helix-bundle protein, partial [Ginsengibacter sp.]|nr:PA2169 family four-helix-bundle protein [Ginsengibacter sp.]
MIAQSHEAKMALAEEVQVMGKNVDKGTTASGKIYRAWMDVKALFTGHSRHSILENCHSGEHAARKAYETALKSEHLPVYLREMIEKQLRTIQQSHDEIQALAMQEENS